MKKLVSVIIPVFNKEKYLAKCLESVEKQSYSNIEVIIVDDGSTDLSIEIAKAFEKKHENFRLIFGKHSGPGGARNIGLSKAKGEYVTFLDADDELKSDYISQLMKFEDFDLVVSGLEMIDAKNKRKISCISLTDKTIKSTVGILDLICNSEVYPIFAVSYTKLYKLNIIKNISFRNISIGEDSLFVMEYLKFAKNIKIISYVGYLNNILPNTLSRKYIKNIWPQLRLLLNFVEKNFDMKENMENWKYLYFRAIKIYLRNENLSYKNFRYAFQAITQDSNFLNLRYSDFYSIKDKLIFKLLTKKRPLLLFLLYKVHR